MNEKEKNVYADVGLNEKPSIFEKMSFWAQGSDNVRLFRKGKWRNCEENEEFGTKMKQWQRNEHVTEELIL